MGKINEILLKQKEQRKLKLEVKKLKKRLPRFIVWFVFTVFVCLFFLEDKFFEFLGNSIHYVIGTLVFLSLFLLIIIVRNLIKIRKKQKESKNIGVKLYNLMKLEADN